MSSSDQPVRRAAGPRLVGVSGLLLGFALSAAGHAAVDLAALKVLPQRGQSADQARRDRYECHHWAVEQSGVVPSAAPARDEPSEAERAKRAERIDRVLAGAAIGAGIGGLVRATQDEDPSHGVLAGAAAGAAVGAATTGRSRDGRGRSRAADAETSDYLRALTACLEGRGYAVERPEREE
jgi:hypothetical protein